ncbi:MAG: hypothetical protein A6F71_10140 [Cycloclasticus sp. symbiont of Poecilosclerida sp. M]|nr:MAG: hypothetical protein A6F71_10140 [Cycloclasticus sp. symbiont of Poecilosclerida sp. M]
MLFVSRKPSLKTRNTDEYNELYHSKLMMKQHVETSDTQMVEATAAVEFLSNKTAECRKHIASLEASNLDLSRLRTIMELKSVSLQNNIGECKRELVKLDDMCSVDAGIIFKRVRRSVHAASCTCNWERTCNYTTQQRNLWKTTPL